MIASIALLVLGAAAAPTPCENLTSLKLQNATITSAMVVPEGPPPARGGGGARGGGARGGGARGGGAPEAAGARGAAAAGGDQRGGAGARGAGARGGAPAAPPANIPAHCDVKLVLKPSSDSHIEMEMWLPTQNWNG